MVDLNLKVCKVKLPDTVNGCISKADNCYTILINEKCSSGEQEQAFIHECLHIWHGDFEKSDVQGIEAEAHGIL